MPNDNQDLDRLEIRAAGEYLETVRSQIGEFRLLTSNANNEVVEGRLDKDSRLTLIPSNGPAGAPTETYYVLSGSLRQQSGRDQQIVGPGGYIVAHELEGVHVFEAISEVRFLYVSSQPFFHEISARIQELQELAVQVELKDGYTADHCKRLQNLSYETAKVLGLTGYRLHILEYGSYLHDLGKVRIPTSILTKPGKLTEDEWGIIRRHPTYGRELLEPTVLRNAGAIVEQHHERLDGSGYPFGLSGDEVTLEAYIVAVSDTYDAMTTDRSYRAALPRSVAFAELETYAGVHYPNDVVQAFFEAVEVVEPLAE